jgi:hypothetical protein
VGSYSDEEESLMPRGDSRVVWSSSWEDLDLALSSIVVMNDDDFTDVFGTGCNGIQYRAKRLIVSGHFDLSKVQVAEVALKSNGHDAIAIRMQSVPSMKKEPYWVMAVIDLATGKFVCPPCSRCDCSAGLNGCSHLRALYAILSFIKSKISTCSRDEIIAMFPPALSTMKGLLIPWQYCFTDSDQEKELKKLNLIAKKSSRKCVRRLESTFDQVADGMDVVVAEDSDGSSYSSNSGDESDSSDSSTVQSFDNDYDLDYETDSDFDEDAEDIFEQLGDETQQSSNDTRTIKLCEFVHEMVDTSSRRAELSNSSEAHEHKIQKEKIKQCLRDLLEGIGGPDGSVKDKLAQLYVHRSLDTAYSENKLPKCLLSFYLDRTRDQRDAMINQLEIAQQNDLKKNDLRWSAQRLEKCPPGRPTLADRGFVDCSPSYPYLNATLHFVRRQS